MDLASCSIIKKGKLILAYYCLKKTQFEYIIIHNSEKISKSHKVDKKLYNETTKITKVQNLSSWMQTEV